MLVSIALSKFHLTALPLRSVPSENLTPLRICRVTDGLAGSLTTSKDSARLGIKEPSTSWVRGVCTQIQANCGPPLVSQGVPRGVPGAFGSRYLIRPPYLAEVVEVVVPVVIGAVEVGLTVAMGEAGAVLVGRVAVGVVAAGVVPVGVVADGVPFPQPVTIKARVSNSATRDTKTVLISDLQSTHSCLRNEPEAACG